MLRKACIIGDPVAHSRSPMIHNHWLKIHGLEGRYEHAHVKTMDFRSFISTMPERGFVGANCTIPHKETALAVCDNLSDAASTLGAVNTIWFENGKVFGDNTDVTGFLLALDHGAPLWDEQPRSALVIGAGGAARAVIYGLIHRKVPQIIVLNRDSERAAMLAKQFGAVVMAAGLETFPRFLAEAGLIINTTSLGMKGQPSLDIDLTAVGDGTIINDIVYVPLETPLLKAAKTRHLTAVGGLDMLLYQAVPGFERWFGIKPVVDETLRSLIRRDIQG